MWQLCVKGRVFSGLGAFLGCEVPAGDQRGADTSQGADNKKSGLLLQTALNARMSYID